MTPSPRPRRRSTRAPLAALLLAAAAPCLPARAADWASPADGLFSTPANWTANTPPTTTDLAHFDTGSAAGYTVTLDTNPTNTILQVDDDTLTIDLAGHTYTLTNSTFSVRLGTALTSADLTLTGPGTLTAVAAVSVGSSTGVPSTLTLDGSSLNALQLFASSSGPGTVTLKNGATANIGNATYVGSPSATGAPGSMTLTGSLTSLTSPSLFVGVTSPGSLTAQSAATLTTNIATLGGSAGASGSVTLQDPGTKWNNANTLSVGTIGTGSITIKNGAALSSTGTITLGSNAAGSGFITVQDAPSTLTAANLYLGGSSSAAAGKGTFTQSAGTTTITGTLKLWNTPTSAINLTGGTLKVGTLDLASSPTNARLNWTAGTLEIAASSPAVGYATGGVAGTLPANLTLSPGMTLIVSNPNNTLAINTNSSGFANTFTVDGGTLTADAPGSKVNVGLFAAVTSTVNVKNAGTVSSLALNIGTVANGVATVTVQSAAHWNAAGVITVGSAGSGGSLNLFTGGIVHATELDIANSTSIGGIASLNVNDPASKLTSTGPLYVARGNKTTGFLYVAGGQVSNTDGYIGYNASSTTGSAQITGPTSSWTNAGTLTVGYNGTGSLSIDSGAAVSDTTAYLGANAPSAVGTVDLFDPTSTWTTTANLFVGGNATASQGSGTLNLHDGTVTVNGTLKIYSPASGATTNTLNLAGGTLRVGTLDTDAAPANFVWIAGTLAITASPLAISPAGPLGASLILSPGQTLRVSQPMTVSPAATLTLNGGTLDLTSASLTWTYSAAPPLNTVRAQLLAGLLTSSTLAPYTSLAYGDTGAAVLVKPTPTGDLNLDGTLDPDDFALLDRSFANSLPSAHWTDGDVNYDGTINNQDYLLIDTAYAHTHAPSPDLLAQREAQFGPQYVSTLLATLPDPTLPLSSILYPLSSFFLSRPRRK